MNTTTALATDAAARPARPSGLVTPLATSVLVALDIDGTLLATGHAASPETGNAVRALRLAGHHVVLASGRSLVGVLPVAHALGLTHTWVVASNGAVAARLDPMVSNGHTVQEATVFDAEPIVRLLAALLPDAQIAVEETGWGYRTSTLVPDAVINGRQRVVPVESLWSRPTSRVFLRGPGVLDLLRPLRDLGVTATPGGPEWVDVTPAGVSKATALEKVRQSLGVQSTHTVAVGDGINDIAMLKWAARGVAMGHAPTELKAVADDVTGSITDNGVIPVLRSLLETSPVRVRPLVSREAILDRSIR